MSTLCFLSRSQDISSNLGELVRVRKWVHMLTVQAS